MTKPWANPLVIKIIKGDNDTIEVSINLREYHTFNDVESARTFGQSLIPKQGCAVYEDYTQRLSPDDPGAWRLYRFDDIYYEYINFIDSVPGRARPRYVDEDGIGHNWTWKPFE